MLPSRFPFHSLRACSARLPCWGNRALGKRYFPKYLHISGGFVVKCIIAQVTLLQLLCRATGGNRKLAAYGVTLSIRILSILARCRTSMTSTSCWTCSVRSARTTTAASAAPDGRRSAPVPGREVRSASIRGKSGRCGRSSRCGSILGRRAGCRSWSRRAIARQCCSPKARGDDENDQQHEGEIEQRRDIEFRHGRVAGTLGVAFHKRRIATLVLLLQP